MDIKIFELYVNDINNFTVDEIRNFKLMTDTELRDYQTELELSTGNLSDWDHLRAIITLKHKVNEVSRNISELKADKPPYFD